MTRIYCLLCLFPSLPAAGQELLWQADFGAPLEQFSTYHADGSGATLAAGLDDGRAVAVATAPGGKPLEGLQTTARGLRGGELCTFIAEVRGSGDVWLIANSRNGWLYSPGTVALTDQWQTIRLTKPLDPADRQANVCLVTRTAGAMRLELRSLRAQAEPVPQTWDRAVAPVRFEAEEFAALQSQIATEGEATVVGDNAFAALRGLPCPRTSRPLRVFLRARLPADGVCAVVSRAGGAPARLNRIQTQEPGTWAWLTGAPFTSAMVGDSFEIAYTGAKEARQAGMIDAVVITTEASPTVAELEAARSVSLGRAEYGAARASAPPELDGLATEACWSAAPMLSGFVTPNLHLPAAYATALQFCYDDANLYLFFRGDEPLLKPELQKIHEFNRSVTARDGRVYNDEALGLVLDTRTGIFDFFVNALGTVADARITGENLWASRDLGFDADVTMATRLDNGFWTIEGRVGLASLGAPPPRPGDVWRAVVGRFEQAGDERSMWTLCQGGLHDPSAFAALRFLGADAGMAAQVDLPERLQLGANSVALRLPAGQPERGSLLVARLGSGTEWQTATAFAAGGADAVTATAHLEVRREGDVTLSYTVLDAVTLQPLLVSPAYPRSVKSAVAAVELACEGPYRLYLNGAPIAAGASSTADKPVQAFLRQGPNTFGLELEQGTAAVTIKAGTLTAEAGRGWRLAPETVADFTAPTTDPRTWAPAPVTMAEDGPRLGQTDGPSRLRRTVLWEDTRLWPNAQPALFINQGAAQHLTLTVQGLPGHLLDDYVCHLALPAPLRLLGVSGYYRTNAEQPEYAVEPAGEVTLDGRPYQLYRVVADQPIRRRESVRIMELFNAFVEYPTTAPLPEGDLLCYFGCEALDGNIIEPLRPAPLRILPPLNGAQCKRLVWQMWGSFYNAMSQPAMQEAGMETMRQAGINNLVGAGGALTAAGDRLGIATVQGINFESWSINLGPWLAEHPGSALIDRAGQRSDRLVCSAALLDDAYPTIDARLKQIIADTRPDYVDWDYESNVMTSYLACFCDRCLTEFRTQAGLAADLALDGAVIERDHLEAWIRFMNLRFARLAQRFKQTAHSAEPPVRLSLYSGYQSDDTKWRYGVDWQLVGDLQAADHVGCGYGRQYDLVRATVEALQGIPLVCGKLLRPYDRNSMDPLVPTTPAELLRRLFDSTGGVLIYDRMPMEGRSWQAVATATRLAARYEDVFCDGAFAEVAGVDPSADWLAARALDGTMLLAALNLGRETKTFNVPLPAGYTRAAVFEGQAAVAPGSTVTIELPAGEAVCYVLTR